MEKYIYRLGKERSGNDIRFFPAGKFWGLGESVWERGRRGAESPGKRKIPAFAWAKTGTCKWAHYPLDPVNLKMGALPPKTLRLWNLGNLSIYRPETSTSPARIFSENLGWKTQKPVSASENISNWYRFLRSFRLDRGMTVMEHAYCFAAWKSPQTPIKPKKKVADSKIDH